MPCLFQDYFQLLWLFKTSLFQLHILDINQYKESDIVFRPGVIYGIIGVNIYPTIFIIFKFRPKQERQKHFDADSGEIILKKVGEMDITLNDLPYQEYSRSIFILSPNCMA